MQTLKEAGLLDLADFDSIAAGLTEFPSGHYVEEVTEAQRLEKFSFASISAIQLEKKQQQQDMMNTKSTADRLWVAYEALEEDSRKLIARCALMDLFIQPLLTKRRTEHSVQALRGRATAYSRERNCLSASVST